MDTGITLIHAAIAQYRHVLKRLEESAADDERARAEYAGRVYGLQLALELLKAEKPEGLSNITAGKDPEKEGNK